MSDPELEEIRKRRMAHLQSEHGGDPKYNKATEERMQAMEEAKHGLLTQVLTQDARARLNTIKLSKPEKGKIVENMICRMASVGNTSSKLSEQDLIQLVRSIDEQLPKSNSTVKFDRRRAALDSDDDM